MKFVDSSGREHSIDIRPSKWPRKENGRGVFQSYVGDLLACIFPSDYILEEFPCVGDGGFIDFFLPRKLIAVEVQGSQHYTFNPFFHKTKADFNAQKARDRRKATWCELNHIKLIKIDVGETEENIKKLLS